MQQTANQSFAEFLDACASLITDPGVDNKVVYHAVDNTFKGNAIIMQNAANPIETVLPEAYKTLLDYIGTIKTKENEKNIDICQDYLTQKIKTFDFGVREEETPDFPESDGPTRCEGDPCPSTEYLPSIDQVIDLVYQVSKNDSSYRDAEIFNVLRELGLEEYQVLQFCKDVIILHKRHGDDYFPTETYNPPSIEAIKASTAFRSSLDEARINRNEVLSSALITHMNKEVSEETLFIVPDQEPVEKKAPQDLLGISNELVAKEIIVPTVTVPAPVALTSDSTIQKILTAQKLLADILSDLLRSG